MTKTLLLGCAALFALTGCPQDTNKPTIAPVGPAGVGATAPSGAGVLPGASSQPGATAMAAPSSMPAGHPTGTAPAAAPSSMPAMPTVVKGEGATPTPTGSNEKGQRYNGTVLETMNAAGYTYLKVKTNTGELWAAVTETQMAVGQQVTLIESLTMTDFHSKTLNRTFPSIVFAALATN